MVLQENIKWIWQGQGRYTAYDTFKHILRESTTIINIPMKRKLLNIHMGNHNPLFVRAFDYYFDCINIDWVQYGEHSEELQHVVVNACNTFEPEYVFLHIQSGNVLTSETIKYLSSKTKVINWTGDVRHPIPQHYWDIGQDIFLTLYSNLNDVIETRKQNIRADFLQVGFDDKQFNPLGSTNYTYQPILFLGSNYSHSINFPLSNYRMEIVNRLQQEFRGFFGVYGTGWLNGNGNITNYGEEAVAYRSCKIAINLSHFAYSRYSSDRMFRIMGSGAFCLSHRFPDMELDFKIGEEVAVWDSIDELIEKIKYYLTNSEERETIAARGCTMVRTKFTWNNFAQNLIDLIEKYER